MMPWVLIPGAIAGVAALALPQKSISTINTRQYRFIVPRFIILDFIRTGIIFIVPHLSGNSYQIIDQLEIIS
jgi:hypothetical protein